MQSIIAPPTGAVTKMRRIIALAAGANRKMQPIFALAPMREQRCGALDYSQQVQKHKFVVSYDLNRMQIVSFGSFSVWNWDQKIRTKKK